ncbi:MAG: amidophosphoribosyltransferase [Kiritimatiellae bacterium]|nr:amidophosphoribosyltransferase [Kiritimatiellia bacterium]
MGGFFGVATKTADGSRDLFYGTDYHSHLGTMRGGMAVWQEGRIVRIIHDITNAPFRTKFEPERPRLRGPVGIGVISDTDDQPLTIRSSIGHYALVTVGAARNAAELQREVFRRGVHFAESRDDEVSLTELVAVLINQGADPVEGIRCVQEQLDGSCSLLLLIDGAILAARDRYGRTPVILGRREDAWAVTMETCAFPNLEFETVRELGPGEIVRVTPAGVETLVPPSNELRICAFLWVYYGYPASTYEGRNVEEMRNRSGAILARREQIDVDEVAGIPDSGVGHGLGYAAEAGIPYRRPFVKYTPTWPRSFMPQDPRERTRVARMKLIPITELIRNKRILFCEDSIVRGTQLRDTVRRLFVAGAREVHMRPACPPLLFRCPFLNFSRSHGEMDLIARRVIAEMTGSTGEPPAEALQPDSEFYGRMCERIAAALGLTSVRYQRLEDMATAIGLPLAKLCTYCWNRCG